MIIQDNLSDGLQLSIAKSCQALDVSCSGYYKWLNQPQPVPFDEVDLRDQIQDIALEFLKKKFKPVTTNSSHGLPVYPNLLKSTQISRPNQVWASDITYVQLMHEHIYLAVIIDLYSRKCIGWNLSRNMGSQLTMNALDRALKSRWTESIQ